MSDGNTTPSKLSLHQVTWQSIEAEITSLQELEDVTSSYSKKLISKVLFLGSIWGFTVHAFCLAKESRFHLGSLEAFNRARFEVTGEVIFWGDKAAPSAAVAIFQAYESIKYLFEVWPGGLVEWFGEIHGAMTRNYLRRKDWTEEIDGKMDPVKTVENLVQEDANLRCSTRAFDARSLCRSLRAAFRDLNLSYLKASALQEHSYALEAIRLSSADEARSESQAEQIPAEEFVSVAAIASLLGISQTSALESYLRRLRQKMPDCYTTTEAPRRTEPRLLYRTRDVWPFLQAWG